MRAPEVGWLETGKPVVRTEAGEVGVSLSHDDRVCLSVAGEGAQGCDLAPVTERTLEEWQALLGPNGASLLPRLTADGGEPLDRAGTRVWAAAEALRKADDSLTRLALEVERRDGDSVLFRDGAGRSVLTFPLQLTRGPERVVSVVVQAPEREEVDAVAAAAGGDLAAAYGYDYGVHTMEMRLDGPGGRPALALRFPLTFRETANLSRTLYFSHYFIWIGKLREIVCQPAYRELAREFATGKWGMVTNSAETRILAPVTAEDTMEGRVWLDGVSGPHGSTQDLHFEWLVVQPDGGRRRVAWSKMRATWVAILDHGVVEARPLPDYFQRFVDGILESPKGSEGTEPLPATVDEIDLGPLVHRVPAGPINPALLRDQVFETSLEDANLVGNIYFGNYYLWQGRARDHFFFEAAPALYRGTGDAGELRCLHAKVEHLREAMPFDRIAVRLSLDALHERGVRLRVDYFREDADGARTKLAFGEHVAGWFAPDDDGRWAPAPLPPAIREALLAAAT